MSNDKIRKSIESLSPEQRALLEQRLRRPSATSGGIPQRPELDRYPMSPGQQRLWKLSRRRQGDPVYNMSEGWRLSGQLDCEALNLAFADVVGRHPALQARFDEVDGQPVQSLRSLDDFVLTRVDGAGADTEAAVGSLLHAAAMTPFDLAVDPLVRASVIELGTGDHLLVLTVHHIVCDGWSFRLVVDDLSDAYQRRINGEQPATDAAELTYFDVAHWLQNLNTAGDLDFWRHTLADVTEPIWLPSSRTSGRPSSMTSQAVNFSLRSGLVDGVKARARQASTSDFSVLLAGFAASLNRSTDQERLVICTPVANRDQPGTENLVGYFNDVIPLVVEVDATGSASQLIDRCGDVIASSLDHATVPLQTLAGLDEVASVPLSRCLFVLQDVEDPTPALPGLDAALVPLEDGSADFDLTIFLSPNGDELAGTVVYRSSHFSRADIDTYTKNFETVLETVVADPRTLLADLLTKPFASPVHDPERPVRSRVPGSAAEARMVSIWSEIFGTSVSPDADFFDLGGHSLLAAELVDRIADEFEVQDLLLSALFQAPTPALLTEFVSSGYSDQDWESLVPIKTTGDRPPLFFVHAHGGNVIGYADLARNLSDEQPLYGLQAPPFDPEQPPRLEDLATAYVSEVRAVQPHGPYVVGGWCLGGDIAFEMAQQLTAQGEHVALVLMIDNPRPGVVSGSAAERMKLRAELEWVNLLEQSVSSVPDYLGERVGRLAERFGVEVERRLTSADGELPLGMRHSRGYQRFQAVMSRERAYEAYAPAVYNGRVALFRAELESKDRRAVFGLGWEPFVSGQLDEYTLPGPRIGLLSEPRVGESARIIEQAIQVALDEFP